MNSERRKDCPMRHENGNCLPAGGFCTAVNNIICDALHNAHLMGYCKAAEKYTEVVRCKDCKFYQLHTYASNKLEYRCANNKGIWTKTPPDAFCSYGERKDEGQ